MAPDLPLRLLAFCAIARPEKFFQQLREAGVSIAEEMKFRDHHAYTVRDVAVLRRRAKDANAGGFITTEKDEINLGKLTSHLQPMSVVPVVLTINDAESVLGRILNVLEQRRGMPVQRQS